MTCFNAQRRRLFGRALAFGAVTLLPACNYDDPDHPDLADEFLRLMSGWNNEVQAALFLEPANPLAHDLDASLLARQGRDAAALSQITQSVFDSPALDIEPDAGREGITFVTIQASRHELHDDRIVVELGEGRQVGVAPLSQNQPFGVQTHSAIESVW